MTYDTHLYLLQHILVSAQRLLTTYINMYTLLAIARKVLRFGPLVAVCVPCIREEVRPARRYAPPVYEIICSGDLSEVFRAAVMSVAGCMKQNERDRSSLQPRARVPR